MTNLQNRRNALLRQKRCGEWNDVLDMQLAKLDARIKEYEAKKNKHAEIRQQRIADRDDAWVQRNLVPQETSLKQRQRELIYERDNNIKWTVEKHYLLESIVEKLTLVARVNKTCALQR